jgi:hypothetical protein
LGLSVRSAALQPGRHRSFRGLWQALSLCGVLRLRGNCADLEGIRVNEGFGDYALIDDVRQTVPRRLSYATLDPELLLGLLLFTEGKRFYYPSLTARNAMSRPSDLGDFRSPGSQDSRAAIASRMGSQPEAQAGFGGRVAGERRITLPGIAQAGTTGLDPIGVEADREQPQSQILLAPTTRESTPGTKSSQVGAYLYGYIAGGAADGGLRMRLANWLYTLPRRVRSLVLRKRQDADLDEELRDHIDRQIEENLARGMSEEEARLAAQRAFGNFIVVREQTHEQWAWVFLERLGQDLLCAFRSARRSPFLSAVAVVALSLGIGLNSGVFTLLNAMFLRPPTLQDPSSFVQLCPRY